MARYGRLYMYRIGSLEESPSPFRAKDSSGSGLRSRCRSVFAEFVVYFFVGACGVISWGEQTPPVITTSYPMDAMGTTARACVMITLFVCIPINTFAARGVLSAAQGVSGSMQGVGGRGKRWSVCFMESECSITLCGM